MVLQLDNVDGTENFQPDWSRHVPIIRRYTPAIERWRTEVEAQMPESLRRRSDAAQLVDKYLWTMSGENSSGDPTVFHDGGAGYGLMADRVSRTPPSSPPDVQIRNAWNLVQNNPKTWTDWGEGSSYQGHAFGALGVIAPYDPSPDAVHPTQGGARIRPPNVGDSGETDATTAPQGWEPPAGYASSSDVPLTEKLRIAREKRLRDTGYIPPDAPSDIGAFAGEVISTGRVSQDVYGRIQENAKQQEQANEAVRQFGAKRTLLDHGLSAASDVFSSIGDLNLPLLSSVPTPGGGPGSHYSVGDVTRSAVTPIPALEAAQGVAGDVGAAAGRYVTPFVPGVSEVGAAVEAGRGLGLPLPSTADIGREVGKGLVPTTPAEVALYAPQIAEGAGLAREAGLKLYDEAAVRLAANETFDRLAPTSLLRHERAGAAIAQEAAGLPVDPRSPFARSANVLDRGAAAPATYSYYSNPAAAREGGAAAGRGLGPEVAGGGAGRRAYGAKVREQYVQEFGEEQASAHEKKLGALGKDWADYGDSVTAFAQSTPSWERDPGSASVRQGSLAVKPDGTVDYNVLRDEIRASVADARAEKVGQGIAEQMKAATSRVRGARVGREAGSEVGGGSAFEPPSTSEPRKGQKATTLFPQSSAKVDGLVVRDEIPNLESISATFDAGTYDILPGVRQVPLEAFDQDYIRAVKERGAAGYSRSERERTQALAEAIKGSGEVNPLIVAVDKDGPYILEGGHRYDALLLNDVTSVPAVVVIEKGGRPDAYLPAVKDGRLGTEGEQAARPRGSRGRGGRPTTSWTINPAEGASYQVETAAGPVSRNAEEAQARFARNTADQNALNAGMAADRGVGRAQQGAEGVAALRDAQQNGQVVRVAVKPEAVRPLDPADLVGSRGGVELVDPAGARVLAPGEQPAAGEVLYHHGTGPAGLQGDLRAGMNLIPDAKDAAVFARAAANEARAAGARQGRMFGGEVGGGRAVPPPGQDPLFDATYRSPVSRPKDENALREGPFLDPGIHDLAQGLEVKPEALGLTSKDDLAAQEAAMRAGSRSKNRSELGRNAAQQEVWKLIDQGQNPAEIVDAMSNAYVYRRGTTPRDRGFIAEMQRLQDKLITTEGGDLSLNWDAVHTEAEGAVRRGDQAFVQDFQRAANAERIAAQTERATAQAGRRTAQVEAIAARQATEDARLAEIDRLRIANRDAVGAARTALDEGLDIRSDKAARLRDALGSDPSRLDPLAVADLKTGAGQPSLPGFEPAPAQQGFSWARVQSELGGVLGIPRTLMTSGPWDMSAVMHNMSVLGARHPGIFRESVGATIKSWGSEEFAKAVKTGIEASTLKLDNGYVVNMFDEGKKYGLKMWSWGPGIGSVERAPGYEGLNASTVSKIAEKLPWVKGSERAYATGMNLEGMRTWEEWAPGIMNNTGLSEAQKTARLTDLASVINHSRGFSGTKAADYLTSLKALFSGQYTVSRFQVVTDPLTMMLRGSPEARNLAAQSLLSFAGGNALMLGLLGVSGAAAGGLWSVNANPLSADFGQLKIGSTRYDTLAGLGPVIKLTSRVGALASDKAFGTDFARDRDLVGTLLYNFFTSKEQPVAQAVQNLLTQNKLPSWKEIPGWFVPMLASSVVETVWNEDGLMKLQAPAVAIASSLGVGGSTYQNAQDVADQVAQQQFGGRKYDDLTRDERLAVIGNAPAAEQKALARDERKGYERDQKKAGFQDYWDSDRKAQFYDDHPEFEAQAWYFDRRTLNNADTVDKVLALNIPDRPVRFSGLPVDIARDDKTRAAWNASKDIVQWYTTDVIEENRDSTARRMYKRDWLDLTKEQQSNVVANIHELALKKDPEADAWMYWWGKVAKTKSNSATSQAEGLLDEFGPGSKQYSAGRLVGEQLSTPPPPLRRKPGQVRQPTAGAGLATAR